MRIGRGNPGLAFRHLLPLLFFFVLFGTSLWSAEELGRFSSISKRVEVFPDSDPDSVMSATPQTVLTNDDHVLTGKDSSAVIAFKDFSTIMMKAESEVIVKAPPAKPSTVELVGGKLWLNLKQVVSGDVVEVKSVLVQTGIEGTIITCRSEPDGSEDVVQVLRGTARVQVDKTNETFLLEEGQELQVRPGEPAAKREIDVDSEMGSWKAEMSGMGSAIELQDIPDHVRQMIERQGPRFKSLKDSFQALTGTDSPETAEVRKEAGRFLGVLIEDDLVLSNLSSKVDKALTDKLSSFQASRIGDLKKRIGEARKGTQFYLLETGLMMKRFAVSGQLDELGQASQKVSQIWAEVEKYRQELEGASRSHSQTWFEETREIVAVRAEEILEVISRLQTLLEKEKEKSEIRLLIKQAEKIQTFINRLLRDLEVPVIDTELVRRLQEQGDLLSFEIDNLRSTVAAYGTQMAGAQLEDQVRSSLGLVRQFSLVRREFLTAQRLFRTIGRSVSSGRFMTSEIEEFNDLFRRIEDRYSEIELAYEDIRNAQGSLETQLGTLLGGGNR